ncbi:MAG: cation diffusion facilitator family transporter [Lachnospiraceae bacterium]|nr:cation diffusion facilitator family transporter [Lachnospiraceae bacterium]
MDRGREIVRTSVIAIAVNIVLVIFKIFVGVVTGSIAIILDAVNNTGDALSSIITILGTKLSQKKPDKKHPYGYGRIEYLTSAVVAAIVLAAGITAAKESIVALIHPEAAEYNNVSLVIIVVGIFAKILCGRYVKSVGEKVHAQALVASGSDAMFDAVLSTGTLVAAIISLTMGLNLEALIGLIISAFIIKSGIEMLLEPLGSLIGERVDPDFSAQIKKTVLEFDEVNGAYDLVLHNYGPSEIIGSVNIEVSDSLTARQIHKLSKRIIYRVYKEHGAILSVGIYASNEEDEFERKLKAEIIAIIKTNPSILQVHGLCVDDINKVITFDLVIDFGADIKAILASTKETVETRYPDYKVYPAYDVYYSD